VEAYIIDIELTKINLYIRYPLHEIKYVIINKIKGILISINKSITHSLEVNSLEKKVSHKIVFFFFEKILVTYYIDSHSQIDIERLPKYYN